VARPSPSRRGGNGCGGNDALEYLELDERGTPGVTNVVMLDKKNLEIADILYNWIGRNVRASNGRRSTQ